MPSTTTKNLEITTADIRSLRTEAAAAGDLAQVKACDRAIDGSKRAIAECKRVILGARDAAA